MTELNIVKKIYIYWKPMHSECFMPVYMPKKKNSLKNEGKKKKRNHFETICDVEVDFFLHWFHPRSLKDHKRECTETKVT